MVKVNNILPVFLKLTLGVGLTWVLYQHIEHQLTKDTISLFTDSFYSANSIWLLTAIVMMPLNWGLESKKWQISNETLETISSQTSWKAILAGISFGMLTPARIGEIGGRLVYMQRNNRVKGVGNWMLCGFTQLLATLFFGSIGTLLMLNHTSSNSMLSLVLIVLISILCVVGFIFLQDFIGMMAKIEWLQKWESWKNIQDQIIHTPKRTLNKVLVLALLRYAVYVFQYFCLVKWLGIDMWTWLPLACIASIFFARILFPLPAFLGLLASGELAILLWGLIEVTEIIALSMTMILWTINLAIPALAGMVIIWKEDLKTLYLQPSMAGNF